MAWARSNIQELTSPTSIWLRYRTHNWLFILIYFSIPSTTFIFYTERKGSKASIIEHPKDHPKVVLVQAVDNNENEANEHNNGNISEWNF